MLSGVVTVFGLPLEKFFALAAGGATITAVGSLIGLLLKETVLSRWFEHWKSQQAAKLAWDRYRIPFATAAVELLRRLADIRDRFPCDYLDITLLADTPANFTTNDRGDPHFRRYKFVSTLYRFSAFWGWVELYRRDVLRLSEAAAMERNDLENRLNSIRSALADGQLNEASDCAAWTDRLIFREEQRSIGEQMIAGAKHGAVLMSYAEFGELLRQPKQPEWIKVVLNFFAVPCASKQDFRAERLRRLVVQLYFVALYLDPKNLSADCREIMRRYASQAERPRTKVI